MSPSKKKSALRLEDQLIILVVTLVIIMMVSVTMITNRRQQKRMEQAIRSRSMSHSEILAISNVEQLLKKDYDALESAVEGMIERDHDIVYVAIYDEEGRPIIVQRCPVHWREGTYSFIDRLLKESIEVTLASRIKTFQVGKDEIIYDTIVPMKIPGLKMAPVGAVRIGFVAELFRQIIADHRNQNIMLTAFFIVLGMIGALVVGRILNKQINATIAARTVSREEIIPGGEYDLGKELKKYLPEYGKRFDKAYKKLSPQDLFVLFRAAREIPTARSLKETLGLSAQHISDIMKASELVIFLKDVKTRELQARMGYDAQGPMSRETLADIKVKEGMGEVWMASEFGTSSLIDTPRPGSGIVSPLASKGKTIGVIEIRSRLTLEPLREKDQLLLELLGSLVATSIEKARIIEGKAI